jgi:hypothetical protein
MLAQMRKGKEQESKQTNDKTRVTFDVLGWRVNFSGGPVGGLLADLVFADIEEEDGTDDEEDRHADDLESETTNHDVDTLKGRGLGGCVVGQPASNRLQDEGDDISCQENGSICPRGDERVVHSVVSNDSRECEVHSGSEENRCDRQTDDVTVSLLVYCHEIGSGG